MPSGVRCTSRKVAYTSLNEAEVNRHAICERAQPGTRVPVRSYECDRCRMWHLTSQAMRTVPRHLTVALAVAYAPTDPISPARAKHWRAVRSEVEAANVRERLTRPFPWRAAA